MGIRFDGNSPYLFQKLHDGHSWRQLRAQDDGIYEVTDQPSDLSLTTIRNHSPNANIPVPRNVVDQNVESSRQNHKGRALFLSGKRSDAPKQSVIERKRLTLHAQA